MEDALTESEEVIAREYFELCRERYGILPKEMLTWEGCRDKEVWLTLAKWVIKEG